jgi:hypothetical protein
MREEGPGNSALQNLFLTPLKQIQFQEAPDENFVTLQVNVIPVNAGFDHLESGILHLKHDVVNVAGFLEKFTAIADWYRACDIRCIVIEFRTGVDEKYLRMERTGMRFVYMGMGGSG